MKLLKRIVFISYIVLLASCNHTWHPEKKQPLIGGCWHLSQDTLKFDTMGNFIYTGQSSYGWVSESKGRWIFNGTYFILNGDSVHSDSLDKTNKKALEYANAVVMKEIKGKKTYTQRSLLFSEIKPLYRNFRNEHFRIQADTLLLELNENGFEENRFKRCKFSKN